MRSRTLVEAPFATNQPPLFLPGAFCLAAPLRRQAVSPPSAVASGGLIAWLQIACQPAVLGEALQDLAEVA
jgi:hypothetical protein